MSELNIHLLATGVDRATIEEGYRQSLSATATLEVYKGVVTCEISGRSRQTVRLVSEGGALMCHCDCFRFAYEICPDVWAAVLAVRRQGVSVGSPGEPSPSRLVSVDNVVELLAGRKRPAEAPPRVYDQEPRPSARRARRSWHDLIRDVSSGQSRDGDVAAPAVDVASLRYLVPAEVESQAMLRLLVGRRVETPDGPMVRAQSLGEEEIETLDEGPDRDLLAILAGFRVRFDQAHGTAMFEIPAAAVGRILRDACATGRACLSDGEQVGEQPLVYDDGPPWRLRLGAGKRGRHGWRLHGELVRDGDEAVALGDVRAILRAGWVVVEERVARLDTRHWRSIHSLAEGPVTVPRAEAAEFVEGLAGHDGELPEGELPEELRLVPVTVAPTPRLIAKASASSQVVATLELDYDGTVVEAEDARARVWDGGNRIITRDPVAEKEAKQRLEELGVVATGAGRRRRTIAAGRFPEVARELLAAGWYVAADGERQRLAGSFTARLSTGIDWLELDGEASFGDQTVSLGKLLDAARSGQRSVRLGDGSYGVLPEDWLSRWGLAATVSSRDGDGARFQRAHAALLDNLLGDVEGASWDEAFERVRAELGRFERLLPEAPGPDFVGELRPYQEVGLAWVRYLERFGLGGCLADDMGLGKTVQILAWMVSGPRPDGAPRPSLLVVPRSVAGNWKSEAARFAPGLKVLDHATVDRKPPGDHFDDHDVVLTTYGILRRDVAELSQRRFRTCILDEAQAIKNPTSSSARAARKIQAGFRVALSGTPIENHLGELWSLFEFLNPGLLGSSRVFQRLVGGGPGRGGRRVTVDRDALRRTVRPFFLRRTKELVAPELPERIEEDLYCDLEPPARRYYDQLRAAYRQELNAKVERNGIGRSKIAILEALLRLRQAALHPGLVDPGRLGAHSAKLDVLVGRLEELADEGHRALVFSQFTRFLGMLRPKLEAAGIGHLYLDGRTRRRTELVERFQAADGPPVFLISLKAGGVGLNLTAASYVFLLDPWWNPAVEAQAIDRTHRIGQTRHVNAYRLIARGTIEEKVLELQRSKRELADAILASDAGLIGNLSKDDLELLLSG